MEVFFFGLILAAFLAYIGLTKLSRLQAHLAIVWLLMGLHLVGVVGYAVYRALFV